VAILLIVNGVFNFLVWPTFLRRVAKDPRAKDAAGKPSRFLIVHIVLVALALALGLASILGGVLSVSGVW